MSEVRDREKAAKQAELFASGGCWPAGARVLRLAPAPAGGHLHGGLLLLL